MNKTFIFINLYILVTNSLLFTFHYYQFLLIIFIVQFKFFSLIQIISNSNNIKLKFVN
jgi:hypothetical protein